MPLASLLLAALLAVVAPDAAAEVMAFTAKPAPGGGQVFSVPVQTLVFLTALTDSVGFFTFLGLATVFLI